MKSTEIVQIIEKTGSILQMVELPETFRRDAIEYSCTFKPEPKYVVLFMADDQIKNTHADSVDELSALINNIDVRYVFDPDIKCRQFYKAV